MCTHVLCVLIIKQLVSLGLKQRYNNSTDSTAKTIQLVQRKKKKEYKNIHSSNFKGKG